MSFKELGKEQKQYLVLGVLAAVILAILAVLGIRFSLSSISAGKEQLAALEAKIEKADRVLARRGRTASDYVRTVDLLKRYRENAPPERNYYSWATQVVYSKARVAGLEIDSIDEINIPRNATATGKPNEVRLETYSLRVTAHGGYENAKRFLRHIGREYPLARFSGIEISKGASPEVHDIQIFMQWPFNLSAIAGNRAAMEPGTEGNSVPLAEPTPPPTSPPATGENP